MNMEARMHKAFVNKMQRGKRHTPVTVNYQELPKTNFINVQNISKLKAIQKVLGLNNLNETLEMIFKHCNGLFNNPAQRIEYQAFYRKLVRNQTGPKH